VNVSDGVEFYHLLRRLPGLQGGRVSADRRLQEAVSGLGQSGLWRDACRNSDVHSDGLVKNTHKLCGFFVWFVRTTKAEQFATLCATCFFTPIQILLVAMLLVFIQTQFIESRIQDAELAKSVFCQFTIYEFNANDAPLHTQENSGEMGKKEK
jgi:hypothetical protein